MAMRPGYLKLKFSDDGDGTGKLLVEAQAGGYAGKSGAYFNADELRRFAAAVADFPLPGDGKLSIRGGYFGEKGAKLEQEHVGIDLYPIDQRGHIGVQVRMATELQNEARSESQKAAKVEIVTSYEPLARFSKQLLAVINGAASEAKLDGDYFGDD
jgi:hypothetical protein